MSPTRRIGQTKIARGTGVHRNTIRNYLHEYNIAHSFSDILDDDLDSLVHEFRASNPHLGLRFLMSYVSRHHLRIQKQRLRDSVHRVDPVSNILRSRQTTRRRRYAVSRPNALWHLDGHHKLIRWGIIIHGLVDGHCRTVRTLAVFTAHKLTTDIFTRLFASGLVQTTGQKQFCNCLWMLLMHMDYHPGCEVIEARRTGMYLFI